MNKPDHITAEEWEAMSPRARRQAARSPETEKAPARNYQETEFDKKLIAAGGNVWTRYQDNGFDYAQYRIYFNEVESSGRTMTVYYDCMSKEWQSGKHAAEFVEVVKSKLEA